MRVRVLGVPLDLGAARRGTDMGPSAVRYARLHDTVASLGVEIVDLGNVHVPVAESRAGAQDGLRFLEEVAGTAAEVAHSVADTVRDGAMPLILGGDHSLSIGTLAGLAQTRQPFGVIWVDAHGDFNTPESSPTGNIHGMPLSVAVGRGAPELVAVAGGAAVSPGHVAIVGARSIDASERTALRASGVTVLTMKDIDQAGIASVMCRALAVAGGTQRRIHLSFDLDALDPVYAPGVGTPVPGGLTHREAHLAMELLADSRQLLSMEFVEVNPILDERNRTASMAVALIASALGKSIY